ncbi:MAG: tRNA (cytidine(34)-2'-O)-methyltransferase [Sinobacteraceae bacterium]|nr:tRNA (cytidine(34)-2'-O)-methyltransferase [Nevskiaceae bacterium]
MLHVILYQPEIPPNTGNIMRLCANAGARLHLIHPLGFSLDERRLRRAGLDYRDLVEVVQHPDLEHCLAGFNLERVFGLSTRGQCSLYDARFQDGDALMFGPETRGLPEAVLNARPEAARLRIPLRPNNRSLNLANAVAISVYEAWRQLGFVGGD